MCVMKQEVYYNIFYFHLKVNQWLNWLQQADEDDDSEEDE